MININCPCCHNSIKDIGFVLLDNIKCPLDKNGIFCLSELNSSNNTDELVSCPKCGNLFHNDCFDEYLKHKNKSNTPIINRPTTVYNTTYNPNLLTPVEVLVK